MGIRLRKGHMGGDFDIQNSPQGSNAILES